MAQADGRLRVDRKVSASFILLAHPVTSMTVPETTADRPNMPNRPSSRRTNNENADTAPAVRTRFWGGAQAQTLDRQLDGGRRQADARKETLHASASPGPHPESELGRPHAEFTAAIDREEGAGHQAVRSARTLPSRSVRRASPSGGSARNLIQKKQTPKDALAQADSSRSSECARTVCASKLFRPHSTGHFNRPGPPPLGPTTTPSTPKRLLVAGQHRNSHGKTRARPT